MIDYDLPYIPDIDSIESFCEAVPAALQYWLDIHVVPEAWAVSWLGGEDAMSAFDNVGNDIGGWIFCFDWEDAVYRTYASKSVHLWCHCNGCGGIYHSYDGCGCGEEDEGESDEKVTVEDLVQLFREIGAPNDLGEFEIEKALVTLGFEAYRDTIEGMTASVEDEIRKCLKAIENAKTNQDLISATMWATRVYHTSGNIMNDYASDIGIDSNLISDIRDNGLESHFERDEIREFLTS